MSFKKIKFTKPLALLLMIILFSTSSQLTLFASPANSDVYDTEADNTVLENEPNALAIETDDQIIESDGQIIETKNNIISPKDLDELQINYIFYDTEEETDDEGRWVIISINTSDLAITSSILEYNTDQLTASVEAEEILDNYLVFYLPNRDISYDDLANVQLVIEDELYHLDIHDFVSEEDTIEIDTADESVPDEELAPEEIDFVESAVAASSEEIEDTLNQITDLPITASAISGQIAPMSSSVKAVASAGIRNPLIIVLDPGHGGADGGASYYHGGKLYMEKEIALKISLATKAELEKYGVTVYMTRTGDTNPSLTDRVNFAKNKKATVLVSQHLNATGTGSAAGALVLVSKGQYFADIAADSQALANAILKELASLGFQNRGLVYRLSENNTRYTNGQLADYYGIIRQSTEAGIPSMIVEHGFIDNASDVNKFFSSDAKIKQVGVADAKAIISYYGLAGAKEYSVKPAVTDGRHTTNPGSVVLTTALNLYKEPELANKTGVKLGKGTTVEIEAVVTSKLKVPVFKVKGGYYISAKKIYSQKYHYDNPGIVVLDTDLNIYKDPDFNAKTGRKLSKNTTVEILKVVGTSTGIPRFKVEGGYISAQAKYTSKYHQVNPGNIILGTKLNIYKDVNFNAQTGKSYAKGSSVKIEKIEYTSSGIPRFKVSGGYISGQAKYSSRYHQVTPASAKTASKLNIYTDVNFNSKTGKTVAAGSSIKILGIGYTTTGIPRFRVQGGYISAQAKYYK